MHLLIFRAFDGVVIVLKRKLLEVLSVNKELTSKDNYGISIGYILHSRLTDANIIFRLEIHENNQRASIKDNLISRGYPCLGDSLFAHSVQAIRGPG